jgi:hypothetical protein
MSTIKIYRINSTVGKKVYIGSTTLELTVRWSKHKQSKNYASSRLLLEEYGVETCSIELLEEVKEDERDRRERYWIEFHLTAVNERLPGRVFQERYEQNRQSILDKVKSWTVINKQYRKEYVDEWYKLNKARICAKVLCPQCSKEMNKSSLSAHIKRHNKVNLSNE